MTISTFLAQVYSSAPTDVIHYSTLEIELPTETLRFVVGFEEMQFGVNGVLQTFEPIQVDLSLPTAKQGGNQTLRFALGIVEPSIIMMVRDALDSGEPSYVTYREYTSADLLEPAYKPARMLVHGGAFERGQLQVECSFYDFLNTAWPRQRYTAETAPGIKYL